MQPERFLSQNFLEHHPEEASQILERFTTEELVAFLEGTEPRIAAAAIQRMTPSNAADCLATMALDQASRICARLPLHTAAGLLRRIEPHTNIPLLESLPTDVKSPLQVLLQYPEDTAGSLMDPRVMTLPADLSVQEVLTRLRRSPQQMLSYLYVIDRDHILVGVTNLRELMLARPKELLSQMMHSPVIALPARADRTVIITHPGWQKFHKIPVVGNNRLFLGVIRYKTLRKLEGRPTGPNMRQVALDITLNLGEAYWNGLSAMVQGLDAMIKKSPKSVNTIKEIGDAT